ncbi:MAG: acetoacetyl-CoA reductase [Pseudomonadota bacterium]
MSQRIAVVTGGAGGLGTAICKALADAGRKVVATDTIAGTPEGQQWLDECRNDGYAFDLVFMDVTDFEGCGSAVSAIETEQGPIEVLINCAGITRDGTFKRMTPDQWRAVLSTNLDSVFNVTKHVVDGMMDRGFGRIVNISSLNGQKGQFGQANYSAAKAGMHGFTMALAQETARKGVTVNTVSPGYVATKMVMAVPEEVREKIVAQIPVGRLGDPREIGDSVVFLQRDESGFITGMDLSINGGQYMH